jgi:hypothetical protein
VAQSYSQTLGSLFDAYYDSQDYGGDSRARLQAGLLLFSLFNANDMLFFNLKKPPRNLGYGGHIRHRFRFSHVTVT